MAQPSSTSTVASITSSLHDGRTHLLLASSGSVATIKLPNMIQALSSHPNLSIRVILTPSASRFLAGQSAEQPTVASLSDLPNVDGVHEDEDEWAEPWKRGAGILHIELRRWADMLVIAPLSANTLAKIVTGMSDSLLTSVVRAWDAKREMDAPVSRTTTFGVDGESNEEAITRSRGGKKKRRIIVAPSMNTAMWRHPITSKQIKVLEQEWGVGKEYEDGDGWFEVLRPQPKSLACNDVGDGAMREWKEIVEVIEERLELRPSS